MPGKRISRVIDVGDLPASGVSDRVAARIRALCARSGLALTRHHLIPRMRHGHKRTRRMFAREELHARILWLCNPCHNHVHTLFSEKELADHYHSREALLAHEDMRRFAEWIGKRPPGFKPHGRGTRRKR